MARTIRGPTSDATASGRRFHSSIARWNFGLRGLVSGTQTAGTYEARWDGRTDHGDQAARGMYFVRANVGAGSRVMRIVLLP